LGGKLSYNIKLLDENLTEDRLNYYQI